MENPTVTIMALQLGMMAVGGFLLWRHVLGREARSKPWPIALEKWEIAASDFIILLWLICLGGFTGPYLLGYLLRFFPRGPADLPLVVATVGFQAGMLAGWLAFRLLPAGRPISKETPAVRKRNPFLLGGFVYLVSLPLVMGLGAAWQTLLRQFGIEAPPQDLIDIFANASSPWILAALVNMAVVIAPITEELVFRASIFRFAQGRLPRVWALLIPACLFATLHTNLANFVPLVALGIIFSLAYQRTGDIRVSMIAHGLFNLNSVILLVSGLDK